MIADIRKKGILLAASLLLLLAAGVYMAFAWYTKMTSASEMSFDAARWEYSANFSTEPIELNICNCSFSYTEGGEGVSVVSGKVAPGVEGYAPVVLSAGSSDVSVSYSVSVDKSLMSDEFKERIYFFQDADMTMPAGDSFGEDGEEKTVITGILAPGETKTIILYWRWVYDAAEVETITGGRRYTDATDAEFDEFDTKVGMNPDKYKADMTAQVLISGTQVEPGSTVDADPEEEQEEELDSTILASIPEGYTFRNKCENGIYVAVETDWVEVYEEPEQGLVYWDPFDNCWTYVYGGSYTQFDWLPSENVYYDRSYINVDDMNFYGYTYEDELVMCNHIYQEWLTPEEYAARRSGKIVVPTYDDSYIIDDACARGYEQICPLENGIFVAFKGDSDPDDRLGLVYWDPIDGEWTGISSGSYAGGGWLPDVDDDSYYSNVYLNEEDMNFYATRESDGAEVMCNLIYQEWLTPEEYDDLRYGQNEDPEEQENPYQEESSEDPYEGLDSTIMASIPEGYTFRNVCANGIYVALETDWVEEYEGDEQGLVYWDPVDLRWAGEDGYYMSGGCVQSDPEYIQPDTLYFNREDMNFYAYDWEGNLVMSNYDNPYWTTVQ